MKHIQSFLILFILALSLTACGASAQDSGRTVTEGRLLLSANGTALLVTEDGTPIALRPTGTIPSPASPPATGSPSPTTAPWTKAIPSRPAPMNGRFWNRAPWRTFRRRP